VGVRYVVFLSRISDGALLALMDAETITTQRTGAVSGVATKLMARPEASTVGVLGSGAEARAQLVAMTSVRPIRSAKVFSPNADHRKRFADEMSRDLGISVASVDSPREAVRGTEVVVLAVKAKAPVFLGEWLEPGMHLNAIGSVRAEQREIDPETFRRSDPVVVDSRDETMESGDGLAAKADGLGGESFSELWELFNGTAAGRKGPESITLFKSVGTALQDLALAKKIYEIAVTKNLGRDLGDFPHIKPTL
jgi:ornithine cyclodeaminase/alanine dehydrogenase